MADGPHDKRELTTEREPKTPPATTLLPMLIGGLVFIIIGMIFVAMLA